MARYRRRPVVIEAVQYHDNDPVEGVCFEPHHHGGEPHVHTLEGPLTVSDGDWIATGIQREKYPIKPDIFAQIYEPAAD